MVVLYALISYVFRVPSRSQVLNNHIPAGLSLKRSASGSGAFSGPFLRLKGSLTRPSNVRVVNNGLQRSGTEKGTDEGGSTAGSGSKTGAASGGVLGPTAGGASRAARKAGTAIHLSTLSPGYDTVTRDPSWLCALCLSASHEHGLGDLFGPYFWSTSERSLPPPAYILEAMRRLASKLNAQKPQLVDASDEDEATGGGTGAGKKKKTGGQLGKRKRSAGISATTSTEAPLTVEQEQMLATSLRAEYWVHEDCACYTQGRC